MLGKYLIQFSASREPCSTVTLAARNPSAEANVVASIRETIARLRELPLLGKRMDEPRVHLLIEPKYLYRVFYRVEEQTIFIIRVLHGAQER
jgi:toxin ParE1/3/4